MRTLFNRVSARSLACASVLALAATLPVVTTSSAQGATPAPQCNGVRATIVGGPGDNDISGTNRRDVIVGLGGEDDINGRGGNDLICGGNGEDDLEGGGGRDTLFGGTGGDDLEGNRGNDRLFGGLGDDEADGDAGRDLCRAEEKDSCER